MQQATLQFENDPAKPSHAKLAAAPRLLIEWTPFWPQFLDNIRAAVRGEIVPPINTTSPKGAFWPDVFVERPPVWERIVPSAFLHALTLSMIFGFSFWVNREARLTYEADKHQTITYYDVSDYLPPVKSAPVPTRAIAQKGQPALARQ